MAEYYKHEIAKWNVATDDLTLEQEAALHRVVGMIRLYERPLRHNLRVLCGLWRCNERRAKRLLEQLISAGNLTIEDGFIINEKAMFDASTLRRQRVDKASTGRRGGVESGNMRRKSLIVIETDEAPASTRLDESASPEARYINGGGGSAREIENSAISEQEKFREKLLTAMGVDPASGLTGRGTASIGTQADMIEAGRWITDLGLTEAECLAEVADLIRAKPDGPPVRFKYFSAAMARLAAAQMAPAQEIPEPKPNATRSKRDERTAFNRRMREMSNGLADGTIHLDYSSRDPFAIKPK